MARPVVLSNILSDLAERIRQSDEVTRSYERMAAAGAIASGEMLLQAKDACRHGEWLPFLARAGMPERKAQRLMQIAHSGLKPDTVSDLGIKGTLELIAKRRFPEPGFMLMVSPGPCALTNPKAMSERLNAYLFENESHPDHFDMVTLDLRAGAYEPSHVMRRPLHRDAEWAVFRQLDEILQTEPSELLYEVWPFPESAAAFFRSLRDETIADAREIYRASKAQVS